MIFSSVCCWRKLMSCGSFWVASHTMNCIAWIANMDISRCCQNSTTVVLACNKAVLCLSCDLVTCRKSPTGEVLGVKSTHGLPTRPAGRARRRLSSPPFKFCRELGHQGHRLRLPCSLGIKSMLAGQQKQPTPLAWKPALAGQAR